MGINVIVGSTNLVKLTAAQEGMQSHFAGKTIIVFPLKASPGIPRWKSTFAPEQPFHSRETAFGAMHRMEHCWQQVKGSPQHHVIGYENGLVPGREVGESPKLWFDICFTGVRNRTSIIIKRGQHILTEFDAPEDADENTFDLAVQKYQTVLRVSQGIDPYPAWTANHPGGPFTRKYFLTQCLVNALKELDLVDQAKGLIDQCAKNGMTASVGPRYESMLWMRDLAYMAPVYLERGQASNLHRALKQLSQFQHQQPDIYITDYEALNRFGKLPIVCLADEQKFLRQRIGDWSTQLWNACANKEHFPRAQVNNLKLHYLELKSFQEKENLQPPSFALRRYMEGELGDLTPGTRDSEIHFIRALFSLVEHVPNILLEFGPTIGRALVYLYMNVLDAEDGLPRGADSRDIFADILYDAKLLTNAVFWLGALESLRKYAADLGSCRETIAQVDFSVYTKNIPPALREIAENKRPLADIFATEIQKLVTSIHQKFLFDKNLFKPRDFIPGKRASIALDHPINPTPIDAIIKKDNPTFITGEAVDPQSLAHAVLARLIPPECYNQVIQHFAAADSKIGVQVFVPISGRTEQETKLLADVKGRVVWPHVSWTVTRALISMKTPEALHMAEVQRDKLMGLGGYSEWVAIDPMTGQTVPGGDPYQGWTATSMIQSIDAMNKYYSALA